MFIAQQYFTQQQHDILFSTICASSLISGLASFILLCYFIIMRRFTAFRFRLIMYLSFCDLLGCISFITGAYFLLYKDAEEVSWIICRAFGALVQFAIISSFIWTACIAVTLYLIVDQDTTTFVERYEKFYHLIAWSIGIGSYVFLYVKDLLGDAGIWCWIIDGPYRLYIGYGPMLFILSFLLVFLVLTLQKTRRHMNRIEALTSHGIANTDANKEIVEVYRLIVIALVLCWIPSIANRIQNYVQPNSPIFWLYTVQGALQPLQGFFNALVYIYPSIRNAIRERRHNKIIKSEPIRDSEYGHFLKLYDRRNSDDEGDEQK